MTSANDQRLAREIDEGGEAAPAPRASLEASLPAVVGSNQDESSSTARIGFVANQSSGVGGRAIVWPP